MLGRLESERLTLRDVEQADAPWFFALNQDPEVMRHLGGVAVDDDVEKTRQVLAQRVATYAACPGLGLGTCCLGATREFIGWFMLRPRTYQEFDANGALLAPTEGVELGYRLARHQWGRGYATEMSSALVRYGFDQLSLTEIVAFAAPENGASISVLRKAGLQRAGRAREHDLDADLYRVVRG